MHLILIFAIVGSSFADHIDDLIWNFVQPIDYISNDCQLVGLELATNCYSELSKPCKNLKENKISGHQIFPEEEIEDDAYGAIDGQLKLKYGGLTAKDCILLGIREAVDCIADPRRYQISGNPVSIYDWLNK